MDSLLDFQKGLFNTPLPQFFNTIVTTQPKISIFNKDPLLVVQPRQECKMCFMFSSTNLQ